MTADTQTTSAIVIVAYGIPGPQGSKSFKGTRTSKRTGKSTPILVESSKKVAPWREAVAEAAARTLDALTYVGQFPLAGPLEVDFEFSLPRPARMPKDRVVGGVAYPIAYPDVSKLARSTEDALTGSVWKDDAQVVRYGVLEKRYAGEAGALDRPGAVIRVRRMGGAA